MGTSKGKKKSASGMEIQGRHGTYKICNRIGEGGNGEIYAVEIISQDSALPSNTNFVIKVLSKKFKGKEYEKRKARLRQEVECVYQIQDEIDRIIPIYDDSSFLDENQDREWYLMPKASKYEYKGHSIEEKLQDMREIGYCILQLHDNGLAHRDIKPQNLMVYNRKVCLSDFGLVFDENKGEHNITQIYDHLGPGAIRPPEMCNVGNIKNIDYKKSDVYLFAKTVWIVLTEREEGFEGEYRRAAPDKYLDKNRLQLKTAEPLHEMMEEATKYYFSERTDIGRCIQFLNEQLGIISSTSKMYSIEEWKYKEVAKEIQTVLPEDLQVFNSIEKIVSILNEFGGSACLKFIEMGKSYDALPLEEAKLLNEELVELNVEWHKKDKKIFVSIENIILADDLSCKFHTKNIPEKALEGKDTDFVFMKLQDALKFASPRIYLNGNFCAEIVAEENN